MARYKHIDTVTVTTRFRNPLDYLSPLYCRPLIFICRMTSSGRIPARTGTKAAAKAEAKSAFEVAPESTFDFHVLTPY